MSNPFFCWHKWERWSSPINAIYEKSMHSTGYFSVCQMRECVTCGKAQVRKIPKMRSAESLKKEL